MIINNIKIIRDENISTRSQDFFTIIFEYETYKIEDEMVLECVAQQDVHLAIAEFMKNPAKFCEMYQSI